MKKSILGLLIPVLLLLTFRWMAFEPFVIPSGSMIPTLQVLDFIVVSKSSFGVRVPFTSRWLWTTGGPRRCDVVVFRSQEEAGVYLVKRVMGLPGERVELLQSGRVRIGDKVLATSPVDTGSDVQPETWREECDLDGSSDRSHLVQLLKSDDATDPVVYAAEVPKDHFLMFGDNRNQSADSRVWGAVPRADLIGKAQAIWLSCESSLVGFSRICDPATLRYERLFKSVDSVN